MEFADDLLYTKEHEWVRVENGIMVVGITDYAQDQLGDIVYVEFPTEGEVIKQGSPFGVIESVKAVSDLYAPVSGKIVEVNVTLKDSPETVNEDPYIEGWMVKVEASDRKELDRLMTPEAYERYIKEELVEEEKEKKESGDS